MKNAHAISYEALCAYGRMFSRQLLSVHHSDLPVIRRDFGSPPQPCRGSRARFGRAATGDDRLAFFISSDVLTSSDPSSERIQSYALLDETTVFVASGEPVPSGSVPVAWSRLDHVMGVPNACTATWQAGKTQHSSAMSVLEPHAARPWGEEFHAHLAVGTSYFVTADEELLAERHTSGLLRDCGVVSPEEYIRIAELELLESGATYLVLQESYKHRIDADVSYYASLAMSIVPSVVRLMRSSWDPRSPHPATARHCHEIVNRLVYLLRARDELARLHVTEGWDRSGNGIRDRQIYHAQYAVILACSLLDSIVRLVADIVGQSVDRSDVSWRRAILEDNLPKWVAKLDETNHGARLMSSARQTKFRPLSAFLHELRDQVAHRGSLDSATVEWRTYETESSAPSRGAIIARAPGAGVEVPGGYATSASFLLLPHAFVDGSLRELVACVEELVSHIPVEDPDWWRHDDRMARAAWDREPVSTTVMRLSGWTSSTDRP